MKRPRRIFIVTTVDTGTAPQFRTGDYNRATKLARSLATENGTTAHVRDEVGVLYTVDAHGVSNTLRSSRD